MASGAKVFTGSYVGNGADNHLIQSCPFQPVAVEIMQVTTTIRSSVTTIDLAPSIFSRAANGDASVVGAAVTLRADGFEVDNVAQVNESGKTYHFICWA